MAKAKHFGVYEVHQDVHVDHDGPPHEREDGTVTGRYELDFAKGRHTAKDAVEQHALEHLVHIDDAKPEDERQPLASLVEPATVGDVDDEEPDRETADDDKAQGETVPARARRRRGSEAS